MTPNSNSPKPGTYNKINKTLPFRFTQKTSYYFTITYTQSSPYNLKCTHVTLNSKSYRGPRRTSFLFLRTPTCVPSMPSVSPSWPRTCNLRAESGVGWDDSRDGESMRGQVPVNKQDLQSVRGMCCHMFSRACVCVLVFCLIRNKERSMCMSAVCEV